ncbi:hypothetical protein [Flavobacterium sp.]|jgi:hypothetical protein|uniref:hypothetical protein n=1 Tax=Flavobacterium sp. TaxID=239 RepID=UPI0037BFBBA8
MKIGTSILAIVIYITFTSCSNKEKQKPIVKDHDEVPQYVKMNNNIKLTDSLFNLAISKGDEKAYNNVAGNYILDANYQGLLYYSTIMANKYNSPEAHFHIFLILSNTNNGKPFNELDDKTKNLALYHLVKSNELGYESAKYSINEVLGKGKPIQKSSYYLLEYSK